MIDYDTVLYPIRKDTVSLTVVTVESGREKVSYLRASIHDVHFLDGQSTQVFEKIVDRLGVPVTIR